MADYIPFPRALPSSSTPFLKLCEKNHTPRKDVKESRQTAVCSMIFLPKMSVSTLELHFGKMKAKTIILESFAIYPGMVVHACDPRTWGAEKGNRNLRAALAP